MTSTKRAPILHEDTDELLGYVVSDSVSWAGTTIFGYPLGRTESRESAETLVRSSTEIVHSGVWTYFDEDDHDWHACRLKEIYDNRVVIVRTDELGFEDRRLYKRVTIKHPTEANLQIA